MTTHISEVLAQVELFNKHKRTTKKPAYARFKLGFRYLDGNKSMMYSYDYYNRHDDENKWTILDEREGFMFLWREVKKQIKADTFITAYIYMCMDGTETNNKNYDYKVAHFVRHRTPILIPLEFIEMNQQEHQTAPRRARIETIVNLEKMRNYFAQKA